MTEEELIKKLESIDFPKIEVESHRRQLRMALLQSQHFEEQPEKVAALKSRLKGGIDTMRRLISWRPMWKPVLVVTAAIALIVGSALFVPSLFAPSPQALAADIAQNSPEVQEILGDGSIIVKKVQVMDSVGQVVCEASVGTFALAEVDLEGGKLIKVEKIKMPELTGEEEARAIEIAKANPEVQELLDKGARIDKVFPLFGMIALSKESGETKIETSVGATVALALDSEKWIVHVDLDKGEAERILMSGRAAGPVRIDMYGEGDEIIVIKDKDLSPMTEDEKAKIIAIAKAGSGVQELLDRGAEINERLIVWSDTAERIALAPVELWENGLPTESVESWKNNRHIKSWMVKIDLTAEKVLSIEPTLIAERAPVKPLFDPPSSSPEELIDMVKTDSRVQELLDKGAKVVGAAGSKNSVSVILELDERDRWVVEIDLSKDEVMKVEPLDAIEHSGMFIYRISLN